MKQVYPFYQLGDDEFENLVSHICIRILGTGTILFAPGKDGGRDGTFSGVAQKFPSEKDPLTGKFIIQAKWTSNPVASCSDSEFSRILEKEKTKLLELMAKDELEHYLVFTNRKKPAVKGTTLEKGLRKLRLKTAHILGIENLNAWIIAYPDIWTSLGFDRFDRHFKIETFDLVEVVFAFHAAIKAKSSEPDSHFPYRIKVEKNKINKLSNPYFEYIKNDSLPYFTEIENFLKNPRNEEYRDLYEDTVHELKGKIIANASRFSSFDQVLTTIADTIVSQNDSLRRKRRFVTIFLHYMYYTCDIGQS